MSNLPTDLRDALELLSQGMSRRELAERARIISESYRGGGTSKPIADRVDALAYALARMPATFAALSACLAALAQARPQFAPASMIDVGAGPGTATWAAAECFSSLTDLLLLDANAALLELARATMVTRFTDAGFRHGPGDQLLSNAPNADLVVASYLVGELTEDDRAGLAEVMWERTRDTLLLVEPGTPAGYARIIGLRAHLVGRGAHVIAPCPHDKPCPLVAPDWCHFAQRLPRTRDHMAIKDAHVPFEDEKFSYVALSRVPAERHAARVLGPPHVSKAAIEAKLCTISGVTETSIPRRDKHAYAAARRWRWGDAIVN